MSVDNGLSPHTLVDEFLEAQPLPTSDGHDCPYLPGLTAKSEGFCVEHLPSRIYIAFMDRGFRRSGRILYRPVCAPCRACRQLRVPVTEFRPSRSQRRAWRRNQDVRVTVGKPDLTDEKWRLFVDYLDSQHDQTMPRTRDAMADFLYDSPVQTTEICYLLGRELVALSVADRSSAGLSSVYTCFAPAHARRSLGTYSVLWEIDYCRRVGIPYYYLGFYVAGSKTMDYKVRFRPCEILDLEHNWIRIEPGQALPELTS